ncbi:MAG: hypothetical protein ACYCSW_06600 [bacterium]
MSPKFTQLQAGQNAAGEQIIKTAGAGGQEHNPGKDFTFSIDKLYLQKRR